ncbi:MAG: Ig-like domain-containing protein [Anaerolineae bacterium]|nr:Ig-like domain-containing protein [Anaerolineae bacterium]
MRRVVWFFLALLIATAGLATAPRVYSAGDLAPQVIDTDPLAGQELPLDGALTIFFDQPMDRASVEAAFQTEPNTPGLLNWADDQTLIFTPSAPLERASRYTFRITDDARSQAGTPLRDVFTLRLNTPGALEVTQILPADGTTEIEATPVITVIFNRPVVPLLPVEEMDTLPSPIRIDPPAEGKGEWLNTSIYTFKPDGLRGGASYTVTVPAGLTDVAGGVLQEDVVTHFSTVSPRVIEFEPNMGPGNNVLLDQPIRVHFSQPMDTASTEAAFSMESTSDKVSGAFSWNDRNTILTFTPEPRLDYESEYWVTIAASVATSATGAPLSESASAYYTTIRRPDIVSTSPDHNARDAQDSGFRFSFSAPMDLTDFADRITVEPEPGIRFEDYWDENGWYYYYGFSHEPSTSYTLTLDINGLVDKYGTPFVLNQTRRIYDVTDDGKLVFRWTTAAYPPSASLRTGGRVGMYSGYNPTTRVFTTHRNIDRVNLKLYRLSQQEFLRLAAMPYQDVTDDRMELLRRWTVDVENPFNVLRYDLLSIALGPSQEPARLRCEGAPPARLDRGDWAVVLPDDPSPLRVRQSPGLQGDILGTLPANTRLLLDEDLGARWVDGFVWYYVRAASHDLNGWVAEGTPTSYFIGPEGASAKVIPATPEPEPDYTRISADAPALEPGAYVLRMNSPEITYGREIEHILFVATGNVTLKVAERTAMAWVTDLQSGQPVSGAEVTFYQGVEVGDWPDVRLDLQPLGAATTDADGLATIDMSPMQDLWKYVFAVVDGGQTGIGFSGWDDGIAPYDFQQPMDYYREQMTAYLYSDRPLYRPGQPVHFRGVLRNKDDMVYTLPSYQTVPIEVVDNAGQTVLTEDAPVTPYGTFSGSFTLDENAPLGFYRIIVRPGYTGGDLNAYEGPTFDHGFLVAQYRVPEFQVEVTAQEPEVLQGDTIRVDVDSTYFFGGAVSNARVEWNAFAENYYFAYEGDGRYSFYDYNEDEGMRATRFGRQVSEGEGMTDARGMFTVEVPADLADASQSQSFTIEATVTDESNQAISGRAAVVVHQGEFYIGVGPEDYVGKANEAQQINLITVGWDSAPQPGVDLSLRVVERRWSSVQTVEPSSGRTVWEYEVEELPVTDGEVRTGEDGKAVFEFTPDRGGIYKVYATGRDGRGNQIRASAFLWVAGPGYVPWRQQNSNRIDLKIDRDNYKVGDTASILIASPFQGEAKALITVERGRILHHDVITMTSNSTIFELPITPDLAPNAFVSVTIVKGVDETNPVAAFRTGLVQFGVDVERLKLNVEITPDREQAGPRQTVTYGLRVTDYQGNPVQAEIGVGITDKAVLSLLPDNTPPLLQWFYAQQGLGVRTGNSLVISVDQQTQEILNTVKGGGGGGPDSGIFEIRERFIDTPLWEPSVVTDANGEATVSVTLPDQLTTWRLDARAVTKEAGDTNTILVGQATNEIISTKPLLIRPVTPRFFVVGDKVVLAAVVNNNTETEQQVAGSIEVTGATLSGDATQTVTIPPLGRARFEWPVEVQDVQEVGVTFFASNADGSLTDAAKSSVGQGEDKTLPVMRYEAPETVGTGGMIGPDGGSVAEGVVLPRRFDITRGRVDVRVNRSLASSLFETLRAMRLWKFSSAETTITRMLANLATYGALRDLNGPREDPKLDEQLPDLISQALQRLYSEQKVDGGWGWFVRDRSDPLVTSWALVALSEAEAQGFPVEANVIDAAVRFLNEQIYSSRLGGQESTWRLNREAVMLYGLARAGAGNFQRAVLLFQYRENMSVYSRALLAMTFGLIDPTQRSYIDPLLSDLNNRAITSATGTHWEESYDDWYNWNTQTRTTAIVLKALIQLDPESPLIPNVVRALMAARQADQWQTTQETAWSVLALADFMRLTGELEPDYTFGVAVNGEALAEDAPATPATVGETFTTSVDVAALQPGEVNRVDISRTQGPGNLYYTAHLNVYLPVEMVEPLDRGLSVTREYALVDDPDQTPITEATVGDTIRVTLTIVAPRDLNYVVITDPIPAGTEAVNPFFNTSQTVGEPPTLRLDNPFENGWGWWWFSQTELRDDRTVLYARYLPSGTYRYTYILRAGMAGEYRVLPTTGQEQYFPEVYGRGAGLIFTIRPAAATTE